MLRERPVAERRRKGSQGFVAVDRKALESQLRLLRELLDDMWESSQAEMENMIPSILRVLLKRCVPFSPAISLRHLLTQCLHLILERCPAPVAKNTIDELVSLCANTKDVETCVTACHVMGVLLQRQVGAWPGAVAPLVSAVGRLARADERLQECAVALSIALCTHTPSIPADQRSTLVKALQRILSSDIVPLSVQLQSADTMLALIRTGFHQETFDILIGMSSRMLTAQDTRVRLQHARALGAMIYSGYCSSDASQTSTGLWRNKVVYDVGSLRGVLGVFALLFRKGQRKLSIGNAEDWAKLSAPQQHAIKWYMCAVSIAYSSFLALCDGASLLDQAATETDDAVPLVTFLLVIPSSSSAIFRCRTAMVETVLARGLANGLDTNGRRSMVQALLQLALQQTQQTGEKRVKRASSMTDWDRGVLSGDHIAGIVQLCCTSVPLLGRAAVLELDHVLSLDSLRPLLEQPGQARFETGRLLCAFCQMVPERTASLLSDLLNAAAVAMAEVTTPTRDTHARIRTLSALHGLVHAMHAIVCSTSNQSSLGLPRQLMADLFATGKLLLSIFRESRQELKAGVPMESSKVLCETGWLLLHATVVSGVRCGSQTIKALFELWTGALGTKPTAKLLQSPHDLLTEVHARTMAFSVLLEFLQRSADAIVRDAALLRGVLQLLHGSFVFTTTIRKSPVFEILLKSNADVELQLLYLESHLFEAYTTLPPDHFTTRFLPLLHTSVARLTDRLAWLTSLRPATCLPDLLRSDDAYVYEGFEAFVGDEERFARPLSMEQAQNRAMDGAQTLSPSSVSLLTIASEGDKVLPARVSVVDQAIRLFTHIFPYQSVHHRHQLLSHITGIVAQISETGNAFTNTLIHIGTILHSVLDRLLVLQRRLDETEMDEEASNEEAAGCLAMATDACFALLHCEHVLVRATGAHCLGAIASLHGADTTKALVLRLKSTLASSSVHAHASFCLGLSGIVAQVGALQTMRYMELIMPLVTRMLDSLSFKLRSWSLFLLVTLMAVMGSSFQTYFGAALHIVMQQSVADGLLVTQTSECGHFIRIQLARMVNMLFHGFAHQILNHKPTLVIMSCVQSHLLHLPMQYSSVVENRVLHHLLHSIQQMAVWSETSLLDVDAMLGLLQDIVPRPTTVDNPIVLLAWIQCQSHLLVQERTTSVLQDRILVLFRVLDAPTASADAACRHALQATIMQLLQRSVDDVPLWTSLITELCLFETFEPDAEEPVPVQNHTLLVALECLRELQHYSRNAALSNVRKVITIFGRAITSSDQRRKQEGLRGLGAVLMVFGEERDPDDATQGLLDPYQSELAAAMRSAIAKDALPEVHQLACCIFPHIFVLGSISESPATLRTLVTMSKALCPDTPVQPGWDTLFSASTCTAVRLAYMNCFAQLYVGAVQNPTARDRLGTVLSDSFEPMHIASTGFLHDYLVLSVLDEKGCRKATFRLSDGRQPSVLYPLYGRYIAQVIRGTAALLQLHPSYSSEETLRLMVLGGLTFLDQVVQCRGVLEEDHSTPLPSTEEATYHTMMAIASSLDSLQDVELDTHAQSVCSALYPIVLSTDLASVAPALIRLCARSPDTLRHCLVGTFHLLHRSAVDAARLQACFKELPAPCSPTEQILWLACIALLPSEQTSAMEEAATFVARWEGDAAAHMQAAMLDHCLLNKATGSSLYLAKTCSRYNQVDAFLAQLEPLHIQIELWATAIQNGSLGAIPHTSTRMLQEAASPSSTSTLIRILESLQGVQVEDAVYRLLIRVGLQRLHPDPDNMACHDTATKLLVSMAQASPQRFRTVLQSLDTALSDKFQAALQSQHTDEPALSTSRKKKKKKKRVKDVSA